MHVLNEYFDRIYCVTSATFYERHTLVRQQFKNIDFEWMVSPSVAACATFQRLHPSEVSVMSGHLGCINNAILHGYKKIAIWEDDGIFISSENEIRKFLESVSTTWDCLYMGNASWCDSIWPLKRTNVSEQVCKILWGNGCGFNGIQEHVYGDLLNIASTFELPIDWMYNKIFERGNTYCPSKKYIAEMLSMPDPRVISKISNFSSYLPSQVIHTNWETST